MSRKLTPAQVSKEAQDVFEILWTVVQESDGVPIEDIMGRIKVNKANCLKAAYELVIQELAFSTVGDKFCVVEELCLA
jgi:hypothetical protein